MWPITQRLLCLPAAWCANHQCRPIEHSKQKGARSWHVIRCAVLWTVKHNLSTFLATMPTASDQHLLWATTPDFARQTPMMCMNCTHTNLPGITDNAASVLERSGLCPDLSLFQRPHRTCRGSRYDTRQCCFGVLVITPQH